MDVLRPAEHPCHVHVNRRAGAEEQRSRGTDIKLLLRRRAGHQEVTGDRRVAFDLRRDMHHHSGIRQVCEVNGHMLAVSSDRSHVMCGCSPAESEECHRECKYRRGNHRRESL